MKTAPTILLGLSGGVDSSVAAYLLQEKGYAIEAAFMQNWQAEDTDTECSAEKDFTDAQAVCDKLNIKLHFVNFSEEYWQRVFLYFLDELQKGRTPNPDILCNREIKFHAFLHYAKTKGAHYIATGHYARIKKINSQSLLLKALDANKDQSYFLSALNQKQLQQSIFPLGEMHKTEVRKIAKHLGLKNHNKKDSTGICFIGERKFTQFLQKFLPTKPGPIYSLENEKIGEHSGLLYYTIGQRQGLNLGGLKGKKEAPWYVVKKDLAENILYVAQGEDPALYRTTLRTEAIHWIDREPQFPFSCTAKIRYRQQDQACIISKVSDTQYLITFSEPQRAITPGQFIVFYKQDFCLGNAIISE